MTCFCNLSLSISLVAAFTGMAEVVEEVAARLGPLKGRRVVRGREAECYAHYRGARSRSTTRE